MDADRFDTLTRSLGAQTSRRAALGATLAGGLLGALGLARTAPQASAVQGGICTFAISANVRLGPSLSQPLSAEGQPGALRGNLSFSVDQSGRLTSGELQVSSGERFPVVGQATGHSLQARIELAPRLALVVVGVGEQEVATCQGAIDGMLSGPQVGDLGDWHAAATEGGGGGSSGGSAGSSGENSGGRQNSGGRGQASGGRGAPACAAGEVFCNIDDGFCAHLATNISNCGACGNRCDGNLEICQDGVCTSKDVVTGAQCASGLILCRGECVDPLTSAPNCGSCGNACVSGAELCVNGGCTSELEVDCGPDGVQCGAICCNPGETCIIGECAPRANGDSCANGLTNCNGACVDTMSNNANCRDCGSSCIDGRICSLGDCVLPGTVRCENGLVDCDGVCIDVGFDRANCGVCGNPCPEGYSCNFGQCVPEGSGGGGCKTGLTGCGGTCVNLQIDPANCGICGVTCINGSTCQFGTCTTTSQAPTQPTCADQGLSFFECSGVCVDVGTDSNNCGTCGKVCAAGETCQGGACYQPPVLTTCVDQGLIECFGACVNLQTDPNNCGFCGEVCPSGQCVTGTCIEAVGPAPAQVGCPDGQADCGGGCIDVISDPANCGFCGNVCAGDQQCFIGGCVGAIEIPI